MIWNVPEGKHVKRPALRTLPLHDTQRLPRVVHRPRCNKILMGQPNIHQVNHRLIFVGIPLWPHHILDATIAILTLPVCKFTGGTEIAFNLGVKGNILLHLVKTHAVLIQSKLGLAPSCRLGVVHKIIKTYVFSKGFARIYPLIFTLKLNKTRVCVIDLNDSNTKEGIHHGPTKHFFQMDLFYQITNSHLEMVCKPRELWVLRCN